MQALINQANIIKLNGVVHIELTGCPSMQDILHHIDQLTSNDQFTSLQRLWDLSDCKLNLQSEELQAIASRVKQLKPHTSPYKTAMVGQSPLVFGLLRVYQAYAENEHLEIRVFKDKHEALAWLDT